MSDEGARDALSVGQRLRRAYADAVAARDPGRAPCVPAEDILALVRREGSEAMRLATLDHVMGCAQCAREFELLRAIERTGGAGARDAVAGMRRRRYATIAVAASLVLAAGIGGHQFLRSRPANEPFRGPETTSPLLLTPGDDAHAMRGSSVVFRWRALPAARSYTLELLGGDGNPVLLHETRDTTLELTLAVPPGEYHWWVRGVTDDGAAVASVARRLLVEQQR